MKTFHFPTCGCSIPIDESLPDVHGHPSLIYPSDVSDLSFNCDTTWDLLGRGATKGVFQLESSLGRTWTKKLQPESIEHLGALGALLRPGCLRAKDEMGISMTEHYCLRKKGVEDVEYLHPALEPLLNSTYGVLCYQEQAMAIAVSLAGFNLMEADDLRKAAGKKSTELMAKVKKNFLEKAEALGKVSKEEADTIFGWIEKSQRYSFNKCVSGDTIIFRTKGKYQKGHSNYTLEEMYKIRNNINYAKSTGHLSLYKKWKRLGHYGTGYSLSNDMRVRPNIIRDIQPAGDRKVLKITLVDGRMIRTTDNHKFPTPKGIMYAANLKVNDKLYVRKGYECSNFKEKNRFSDVTIENRYLSDKKVNQQFGEKNCSFTNGSYTDYMNFKQSTPDVCFICNRDKTQTRIECHHINGDRKNSSPNNLQKLCASCHKKEQYKLGRVKVGEKGYPTGEVAIMEITYDGVCMTYDVTMDAPNHTFVIDNGIITCNSHAISYALVGYHTAHAKAHFPVQFYTSYLYFAQDKQDPLMEIRQLVNDARTLGIEILPPDITNPKYRFNTDGVIITFGMSDVKGLSDSTVSKVRNNIANVEKELGTPVSEWSWFDFLTYCSPACSSSVVSRLIEVGAMRNYHMERQRMLAEYHVYNQLTEKEQHKISQLRNNEYCDGFLIRPATPVSNITEAMEALLSMPKGVANKNRREKVAGLLKSIKEPPRPMVDTPQWIAKTEQECLGIPITNSVVEGSSTAKANITCQQFRDGKNVRDMVMAVEITECREVRIQNGNNRGKIMAFLVVNDETGSLEDVCVFSTAWEKCGNLIYTGAVVELAGKKDKDRGSFIVEDAWKI